MVNRELFFNSTIGYALDIDIQALNHSSLFEMGDFFCADFFLGDNLPRGIFSEGYFKGGFFTGGLFPGTALMFLIL